MFWANFLVSRFEFRKYSDRLGDPHPGEFTTEKPEDMDLLNDVRWAVESVNSTFGGRFTCLMKGMAGKSMLNRRGVSNSLVLGAKLKREIDKENNESMAAHAWLYAGPVILLGGQERPGFLPVTSYYSASQ